MKTIIYFLLAGLMSCLWMFPSSTSGQKMTTEDFLKTHDVNDPSYARTFPEILAKSPPINLQLNKFNKQELSDKCPIVVLSDSAVFYPTPYILFSLEQVEGDFTVDCKGYGTPWGFKKVIMLPNIILYDQDGNLLNNQVTILEYEEKMGVTEPDYFLMRINVKVERPGKFYLLVCSINYEAMKKLIWQNGPYGKIAVRVEKIE